MTCSPASCGEVQTDWTKTAVANACSTDLRTSQYKYVFFLENGLNVSIFASLSIIRKINNLLTITSPPPPHTHTHRDCNPLPRIFGLLWRLPLSVVRMECALEVATPGARSQSVTDALLLPPPPPPPPLPVPVCTGQHPHPAQ